MFLSLNFVRMENLTRSDLTFIKESLEYSKQRFENYDYANQEIRLERIEQVQRILSKIHNLIREVND